MLCLCHKAAYKALSTVKRKGRESYEAKRLNTEVPYAKVGPSCSWWLLLRSLVGTRVQTTTSQPRIRKTFVCTSSGAVMSSVSAAEGFRGFS